MIWKEVPNYEGYYKISENGDVMSVDRTITRKDGRTTKLKSKELKPYFTSDGYKRVALTKNGKAKHILVHRLVSMTFHGVPDNHAGLEVNHIDENKENNHYSNLEWCSHLKNMRHSPWINDRINKANSVSVIAIKPDGEKLYYNSIKGMAQELNIKIPTAHDYVRNGHILKAGRMKGWQFIYGRKNNT